MAGLSPTESVEAAALQAQNAARELRGATTSAKNALLVTIADELERNTGVILEANRQDIESGRASGMAEGLIDRLLLTEERIAGIAAATREVAGLPDPVGEVVRGQSLPNGLQLRQIRVPMGVIGMIYEARPNVTVDAAALALKAGSAVLLRGGRAALRTNAAIVDVMRGAVVANKFSPDLVATIDEYGREGSVALMRARGLVDLVIPRGGAGLIKTVVSESLVPVIETGVGNCHVYVDAGADLEKALAIAVNSKTHRPSVCNAAETLLVHSAVADEFVPRVVLALQEAGVTVHGCERVQALASGVIPATQEDWETEYLALEMAVRVVDDIDDAIAHIRTYSTGHTEAIVSQDVAAVREFTSVIDSAALMVNASTRFTDGGQLGLGAEIGISTQKLHARGPMGLTELTTTTWIVEGDGHVRI